MIDLIRKVRFFYLIQIKWRRFSFGKNPYIGKMVYMYAKNTIKVGDDFYIGKFSQIECDAEIGNNVIIANFVAFVGKYDHNYQQLGYPIRQSSKIRDKDYNWKGLNSKVVVGDDVWIGFGSIIMSGVTIAKGSIIAAGSVVTKNVDSYSIYGGIPATKIGERFENKSDFNDHIRLYNLKYEQK